MSGEAPAIDALRARVEEAVGSLFAIEEEIGRGGMAVVYRARDLRLRRKVALKVLPPELAFRSDVKSRFIREAQMSAQLSHPNIVPIYAVDEHDGIVYFSMGLVDGETLAQLLHRDPRPAVATVRRVLQQVCYALGYAHGRGVVHRDVKPDNILVEHGTGVALVSDFGIARAAEGDMRLTATGVAVGTPAYMSPEQAMGEKEVDGRADIYSLGVVGFQMLAGELPFQSENTPGMLMKHISEHPRPLTDVRRDLPTNLVYAIERAMAKGRAERWRDAAAFGEALDESASGGPVSRAGVSITGAAGPGREKYPPNIAEHLAGGPAAAAVHGAELGVEIAGKVLSDLGLMPRDAGRHGGDGSRGRGGDDSGRQEERSNAIREWREQQRLWRERNRPAELADEPLSRRELRRLRREGIITTTPEEKIRRIQRSAVRYVAMVGVLASINMIFSPRFPWFIFPTIFGGIALMSRIGGLWVDGISVRRLFQRQPESAPADVRRDGSEVRYARDDGGERDARRGSARKAPAALPRVLKLDLGGVPPEVLDGPHGNAVRDAAESKAMIVEILGNLPPGDKAMLPEVQPTVNALVERTRALAQALTQLDRDASPDALARLEQRIGDVQRIPAGAPDRDRRIELLERQRATLRDLAASRDAVAHRLDSALLVLQTMKLDLLRLRSSGVESKLADSVGATQEARAVAVDIQRVIEAADEVRKM